MTRAATGQANSGAAHSPLRVLHSPDARASAPGQICILDRSQEWILDSLASISDCSINRSVIATIRPLIFRSRSVTQERSSGTRQRRHRRTTHSDPPVPQAPAGQGATMQGHRSTPSRVSRDPQHRTFDLAAALKNLRTDVVEIEALARATEAAVLRIPGYPGRGAAM